MEENNYNKLMNSIRTKNLVVFIGAGISRNLKNTYKENLPSWNDLLRKIAEQFNLTKSIDFGRDSKDILKQLSDNMTEVDEAKFKKRLDLIFNVDDENFESQQIYSVCNLISLLSSNRIVTTNYDDLFKKFFFRKGIDVVEYTYNDVSLLNRFTESDKGEYVVKIHGSYDKTAILFKRDYENLYHSDTTTNSDSRDLKDFLEYVIRGKHILFLGYGLGDDDINNFFFEHLSKYNFQSENLHFIGTKKPNISAKFKLNFIQIEDDPKNILNNIIKKLDEIYSDATKDDAENVRAIWTSLIGNIEKLTEDKIDETIKLIATFINSKTTLTNVPELGIALNLLDKFLFSFKKNPRQLTTQLLDTLNSKIENIKDCHTFVDRFNYLKFRAVFELQLEQFKTTTDIDKISAIFKAKKDLEKYLISVDFIDQIEQLEVYCTMFNQAVESFIHQNLLFEKKSVTKASYINDDDVAKFSIDKIKISKDWIRKNTVKVVDASTKISVFSIWSDPNVEGNKVLNLPDEKRFVFVGNPINGFVDIHFLKKCLIPNFDNVSTNYDDILEKGQYCFSLDINGTKFLDVDHTQISFITLLEYLNSAQIRVGYEGYRKPVLPNPILSPFVFFDEKTAISYKSIFNLLIFNGGELLNRFKVSDLSYIYQKNRNRKVVEIESNVFELDWEYEDFPYLVQNSMSKIGYISQNYHLSRTYIAQIDKYNTKSNLSVREAGYYESFTKNNKIKEETPLKIVFKHFGSNSSEPFIWIEKEASSQVYILNYFDVIKFLIDKYKQQ